MERRAPSPVVSSSKMGKQGAGRPAFPLTFIPHSLSLNFDYTAFTGFNDTLDKQIKLDIPLTGY